MRRLGLLFAALLWSACGKPQAEPHLGPAAGPASQVAQAGYCERLSPLLGKAVSSSRIGTEMSCLDIPGVTEIGRFGASLAAEEGSIVNCFDDPLEYGKLLEPSESDFELSIDQDFSADSHAGGGLQLTSLVPWIPSLDLDVQRAKRVTARITVKHARFVTLLGLATKLQGQKREQECLEALCKSDYRYVHKALVGIPTLTITAEDESGHRVGVRAPLVASHFSSREVSSGSQEISSTEPVTLAIARSAFRTAQTERLCQFCGRRGQSCCKDQLACDGGLGCIADQCVEVGGADQPCDGQSCAAGACVSGRCRVACGRAGQPCCGSSTCGGGLRCAPDPDQEPEPLVNSEATVLQGGLLGTSDDRTFGASSCGPSRTRGRFAISKLGTGRGACEKAWWFDPNNDKDCRVAAHFEVSALGAIACKVDVFAAPATKPDLCVP